MAQVSEPLKRGQKLHDFGAYGYMNFCVLDPKKRTCVATYRKEYVLQNMDVIIREGMHESEGQYYCTTRTTYDEYIKPISKKFGIGIYYCENEPLYTDEDIQEFVECAELIEAATKAKNEEAARERAELSAELAQRYSYLTRITDRHDKAAIKANLVSLLKHEFPGVKFSVKLGYRNSMDYNISYIDGPTAESVEAMANLFRTSYFDGMEDYAYRKYSEFAEIFGGLGYIFVKRKYSVETLEKARKEILEKYPEFADEGRHSAPFELVHLRQFKNQFCLDELCHRYFDETDLRKKKPQEVEAIPAPPELFQIIDYSEKAFALTGETKKIKDDLKRLGGRFNPRLSCGAGWIFSKKSETEVRAFLACAQ